MADAAVDPKSAPLAEDLKEFALSLDSFPKNLACAVCNKVAVDAYKLICCNKAVCSSCQANLEFGETATCPLCEHQPLEAESCIVHKTLRNTIRIWLSKQQKKMSEKAASEAATPVVETALTVEAPVAPETAETTTDEVEAAPATDASENAPAPASNAADEPENGTAAAEGESQPATSSTSQAGEDSAAPTHDSQNATEEGDGQGNTAAENGSNMYQNGMTGQFGNFAGQNQAGFNGMSFNGINAMNGMSNMMGNGMYMNSMAYGMNNMNGMYGNYGGNMGMGMNNMSMNYGGGYGNGWSGMGGAGYGGYNDMGGHDQSGAYPGMMNQYPNKNNFQNQNRYNPNGGTFPLHRANRNGSFGQGGGHAPGGNGYSNANSRPGSGNGPHNTHCDGQSPAGSADATGEPKTGDENADATAETTAEGKDKEGADSEIPDTGENAPGAENLTEAGNGQTNALNRIQTVETGEDESQHFDYGMQAGMEFAPQYPQQQFMNDPYQQQYGGNNFGHRANYDAAYGSAQVLVGEPRGLGVAGAPTGPRAMREGKNFRGPNGPRFGSQAPHRSVSVHNSVPGNSPRKGRSKSPVRDDTLRTKERSLSRSRSKSPGQDKARDDHEDKARPDRDDGRISRARTPAADDDYERRSERRYRRSSRYDDERDDYNDRHSRGNRTRSATPESKHRSSRRDDKHRSSRSHRDRSREHRRRHRSHSRDPIEEEDDVNGGSEETSSRRRGKGDKDKYRERSRDRERDRDSRRDRDRKDRDYDDDKYRSRDKDKDKERDRRQRRKDREAEEEYDDDRHRSSRRSRKDRDYRDRERDNDRDHDKAASTRALSPPLNAPVGPSADRFSFRGASSKAKGPSAGMPPPSRGGPSKGQPADREKRDRTGSVASVTNTPAETTVDHYAAERERNARERAGLTASASDTRDTSSYHSKHASSSHSKPIQSRISGSSSSRSKRARDEVDAAVDIPTGPSGSHRDKRRKSRDAGGNGGQLANLFTKGLRKSAGKRGGVKTEGDVERELERTERERDGRRW